MRIRMLNILELRYYRFDIPLTVKTMKGRRSRETGYTAICAMAHRE